MTDDVLRGVREAREAFARSHGYDVRAMVAALGLLNEAGDWPVVSLPPRPPRTPPAVETPRAAQGLPAPIAGAVS